MPDFDSFYRAMNGRDPFPWQRRLAQWVEATETWPTEIGIPTGLGKTACLDIAVWWLASQACRSPATRSAPTRIWWVVNRRLLVDAVTEHADSMKRALAEPSERGRTSSSADVVAAVATRLRSLSSDPNGAPLEVIRLRGGVETRTPSDPSQPAILLSTVPMYGSRLLFRGYGSSRMMRPVDAAMAGTDSLVLLDEAHLAPHLRTLLAALDECAPNRQPVLPAPRSRPMVVPLTATGERDAASRFDLDAEDDAHSEVRRRLDAPKPLEVRHCKPQEVGRILAESMSDLLRGASAPAAGLVFANTPKTARVAFQHLQKRSRSSSSNVLLLTGQSRQRESKRIQSQILDETSGMASGTLRSRRRDQHLVVVATQTLEVGADIDAEFLVTETCGVRALTQRLGRLNRLGRHAHARAIYLHAPPPATRRVSTRSSGATDWPIYGEEPGLVAERLEAASTESGGRSVDLSPRKIAATLGPADDKPSRAPEILHGLLWEWMKTTNPPEGEAPVEPYFAGISGGDTRASVIWRAHVREDERLWPRARDFEAVGVPIGELRAALDSQEEVHRIGLDGLTAEKVSSAALRPGDTIVLSSARGLLDDFGWNPSSVATVVDVSLIDRGIPLDCQAIKRVCGQDVPAVVVDRARGVPQDGEEVDDDERREAAAHILQAVRDAPVPEGWGEVEWRGFVESLSSDVQEPRGEIAHLPIDARSEERRSDELDELSLTDDAVQLDAHGDAVAERALAIGRHLGLTSSLAEVVAQAGRLHDIGKAESRFQRWLDPNGTGDGSMLAKSNMPRHRWQAARAAAGWPAGGRHEALSARLVESWLSQDGEEQNLSHDLLLHLVVSHHGHGRPLVAPVNDLGAGWVRSVIAGNCVTASADLSQVDWCQPARFRRLNREYGPWGLALLEATVRLADHAVSARSVVVAVEGQA